MGDITLVIAPCRHLGTCPEVLYYSLPGHGGGSMQVMAGKWHSLGILYPSLLKIVSSDVSNLLILGICSLI